MNALESELQGQLLLRAPAEIPNLRLFRRNIGVARGVSFGIKGQSDLYGIFRGGLHIEIEIKAVRGTMSPEQIAWQAFCEASLIPHLVLRPYAGESVSETVGRWIEEIRATRRIT